MTHPYLDEAHSVLGGRRNLADSGVSSSSLRRFRSLIEETRAGLASARLSAAGEALVKDALTRLAHVAAAYETDGMEARAAATYRDPSAFRADLELLLALSSSPDETRTLLAMQSYAQRAAVPQSLRSVDLGELAIDREVVLQRLSPALARSAPHQLQELSANFDVFRRRYERVYRHYHQQHQEETRSLRSLLQDNDAGLHALKLLNDIAALGAPLQPDLAGHAEKLQPRLVPCAAAESELREHLQTEPRCPACDLELGARPPSDEVQAWQRDLHQALTTQQRRLARAMVSQAVAETERPAFDRFLRALRAGDVAPLIDVMNHDVAALIRDLLSKDG